MAHGAVLADAFARQIMQFLQEDRAVPVVLVEPMVRNARLAPTVALMVPVTLASLATVNALVLQAGQELLAAIAPLVTMAPSVKHALSVFLAKAHAKTSLALVVVYAKVAQVAMEVLPVPNVQHAPMVSVLKASLVLDYVTATVIS